MTVLFVLENYYPHIGGVETLFQTLAEKLALQHRVIIVTSQLSGTKRNEKHNGVEIARVSLPPIAKRYFFTFLSIPTVYKYAQRADIIQTTTYNAAIPAWFVGKLLKKPVVITVHEVLGNLWFKLQMPVLVQLLHFFFEKLIISLPFTKYVTDSNFTRDALLNSTAIHNSSAVKIYCGIDYSRWSPFSNLNKRELKKQYFGADEGTFCYLFFGRPGWVKGVDLLVKAVQDISDAIPNSKLILLLSKEPASRRKDILQLITSLRLEDKVKVLNSVKGEVLPYIIRAADCVVIPSLSEGFGFAAVESLALKVPVVARDVGSLKEVTERDWRFSSDEELVSKLKKLASGQPYQFPNTKYHLSETVENYEKLYQQLEK